MLSHNIYFLFGIVDMALGHLVRYHMGVINMYGHVLVF